jgi:hypothetical protein
VGTCLSAAVQQHYDAREDIGSRASWDTVAIFEFNKDYALSNHLYELRPDFGKDEDWPGEAEFGVNCQKFAPGELPGLHAVYNAQELSELWGLRYLALRDVSARLCSELGARRVRVLFWRDQ